MAYDKAQVTAAGAALAHAVKDATTDGFNITEDAPSILAFGTAFAAAFDETASNPKVAALHLFGGAFDRLGDLELEAAHTP